MQLIKQIRDLRITIVVVEHIVKAILGLSDRIVVLNWSLANFPNLHMWRFITLLNRQIWG
jgi:ABC-type branched-subunit amino acid transport system ATPase component